MQCVFEGLDDALFVVDPKTRTILDCNPAVEKIFGYRPEEIIGCTTAPLHLNRRMFLQFARISLPALEEKGVFRGEYLMRRRDGSVFISEHAITRVTKPGRPLVVVSLVRDVTESRRAKDLLQVQRDLALSLTETNNLTEALHLSLEAALKVSGLECGGIYLRDDQDDSLRLASHRGLSPSFVRAATWYGADTGNARLVIQGRPLYGCHPDLKLALSRSERREGLRALAIIPICHKKRVIACLNVASRKIESIPEYSRAALEAIASQIGLSIRQVRAEENSRQSEQKYSLAESLVHIGHWERDFSEDRASWSPELFRIFGINPQGGAPNLRKLLNRVHPQDRDRLQHELNAIMTSAPKKKKPVLLEYRIIRPDGRERFLSTTAQPVLSSNGRSVTLRGTLQDITDRRVLENRITAISKAERTSLQRDLHDTVCQQLTGLAFLAEEIKQDLFEHPEQAARDLEKIIEINQTALGQAKEVARGLTPLTDEPEALENALREMARYVSLTYRIPCRFNSPQRILPLDSLTSTQLYLIAREAAVNAARHGQGRLIRITLSHRGNSVTIRVTDDGRGLNPEQKRDQGLGLETMKQRADLIGARLKISLGKKRGTVVECHWTKRITKGEQGAR